MYARLPRLWCPCQKLALALFSFSHAMISGGNALFQGNDFTSPPIRIISLRHCYYYCKPTFYSFQQKFNSRFYYVPLRSMFRTVNQFIMILTLANLLLAVIKVLYPIILGFFRSALKFQSFLNYNSDLVIK